MYPSLRNDQSERWQRGDRVPVENYVEKFPDLQTNIEALVNLIEGEIDLRRQRGESPTLEEYVQRFPRCADQLRQKFPGGDRGRQTPIERPASGETPASRHYETIVSEPEGSLAEAYGVQQGSFPNIPGFEILGELGRGGMGIVYRARQLSADRIVALKVVRNDVLETMPLATRTSTLERFRSEAQAAAKLEHDNLVTVFEVGQAQGLSYYAMRYVEGKSLNDLMDDGPLDGRRAARYLEPVARALHMAHQQGILHRDLKPHNVLVDARTDRPMLADFGLAKFVERQQDLTLAGEVMGTPSYMSPEQAREAATVTPLADVYSLGATLYDLITGRPPFLAASLAETIRQICEVEPVPPRVLNPAIDRDLETICLKCLQKEPPRRYASAAALADDLKAYLEGRPIVARPVGPVERLWRGCRRNPRLAGTIAAAAASAVVAVVAIVVGYVRTAAALNQSEARLQRTLAAINEMFVTVTENELLDTPGAQQLQNELLEKALRHYNYFLAETGGDPKIKDEIAATHYRVGRITARIGAPDAARHHLTTALRMQEELLEQKPNDPARLKALGDTLNELGNHFASNRLLQEAASFYARAVEIRNQLLNLDRQNIEYSRLLANARMNLGLVEKERRDFEKARTLLKDAQDTRLAVLKSHPDATFIRRDVAMGYYNMANVEIDARKLDNAEPLLRLAIEQFEILLAQNPRSLFNRYYVSQSYRRLGTILAHADDMAGALTMFDKAQGHMETLAVGNPDVIEYQLRRAELAMSRAVAHEKQEELPSARGAWELCLATVEGLRANDPKNADYREMYATALAATGSIHLRMNDPAGARAKLTAARDEFEALLKELPGNLGIQQKLEDTLGDLALCDAAEKKGAP
jgi:serine/threonine-protein kinase